MPTKKETTLRLNMPQWQGGKDTNTTLDRNCSPGSGRWSTERGHDLFGERLQRTEHDERGGGDRDLQREPDPELGPPEQDGGRGAGRETFGALHRPEEDDLHRRQSGETLCERRLAAASDQQQHARQT